MSRIDETQMTMAEIVQHSRRMARIYAGLYLLFMAAGCTVVGLVFG